MTRRSGTCPRPRPCGFTLVELLLVVGLSAILLVRISALVEVPRRVAEEKEANPESPASAGRVIDRLDRDVRHAVDVRCPNLRTLEIDLPNGRAVTYSWAGTAANPLVRSDGATSVALLDRIGRVGFSVGETRKPYKSDGEGTVSTADVPVGGFSTFTLEPGYSLAPLALSTVVDELVGHCKISDHDRAGIVLETTGLADDASLQSLRCRLRRRGSHDLNVEVRVAHATQPLPLSGSGNLIATGRVANGALPVAFADVVIPLTPTRKVKNNTRYFIELRSDGTSYAADVEHRSLSIADAASAAASALVVSDDDGIAYDPVASTLDASQTVFELVAEQASVAPPSDASRTFEMIKTSVQFELKLLVAGGTDDMCVSFPLINNVARLHE